MFRFRSLMLSDLIHIQPQFHSDSRGLFLETYRRSTFVEAGISDQFVQDNRSLSKARVLRGLHFQAPPKAQAKLISVLRGRIFDVAVDIRVGSPTFGSWAGLVLDSENGEMLYIPEGFAHGFCVLGDEAEIAYKVSCEYSSIHDRGIIWSDSAIGIEWPLQDPVVSKRDASLPSLADLDLDLDLEVR